MQTFSDEYVPKYLRRVLALFQSSHTINADVAAGELDIDRARASAYLNELERIGYLKRFREKRRVEFFLIRKYPSERGTDKKIKTGKNAISERNIGVRFNKARFWLKNIQNNDGGWGQFDGDSSSLINTAESILALTVMGEPKESITIGEGLNFIVRGLRHQEPASGQSKEKVSELEYARAYARMGLAFLTTSGRTSTRAQSEIALVASWLHKNQDREGYWDLGSTYSTAMSMRFLALLDDPVSKARVNLARDWLLRAFSPETGGWECKFGKGFNPVDKGFNLAATAHVLFSLSQIGFTEEASTLARDRLFKEVDNWSGTMEEIFKPPGSKPFIWKHSLLSCALAALLSYGEKAKTRVILDGIQMLIELQDTSGGWRVVQGDEPKTWTTLNSAIALELFRRKAYHPDFDLKSIIAV